jgi:hypothetical protein
MKLELKRTIKTSESTIGELYVDGVFECYTLEDVVRDNGEKVYGKTAIPAGTYKVICNLSNRFQRIMPLLLNVPGFEGVRIHSGNSSLDTEGCILVGRVKEENRIGESKLAYSHLFPQLQAAKEISITIS